VEDLLLVLEAGRLAPTAVNKQPLCFIVLLGEQIARLKPVYDRDWFLQAPCVIVVCADHQSAWVRKDGKSYADVDAAIAMDHMILAAADRGLGSCWIGAFDRQRACEALRLPEHVEPIVMTPLGYGVSRPEPKPRKSLEELTCWGVYGNKSRGQDVM
jgi:nitroreductase